MKATHFEKISGDLGKQKDENQEIQDLINQKDEVLKRENPCKH